MVSIIIMHRKIPHTVCIINIYVTSPYFNQYNAHLTSFPEISFVDSKILANFGE